MRASNTVSFLAGLVLLTSSGAQASDCRYSAERNAELDATGARILRIEASAGFLVVEGSPDLDRVMIEARACTDDEDRLDDIRLRADRRGDSLSVIADIPDQNSWGWGNSHASLDMTLRVPSGLELDIDDGSGSIELRGVGAVELEDGSGEIRVENGGGDLRIEDGSGEITLRGIRGDVRIEDGSGGIEIRDISGTVVVSDGSGEIDVERVARDVEIDEDGSGSIYISGVEGNVKIGSDGSGSIDVEDVRGDFVVRRDGSGSIHHRDIDGQVRLPRDD